MPRQTTATPVSKVAAAGGPKAAYSLASPRRRRQPEPAVPRPAEPPVSCGTGALQARLEPPDPEAPGAGGSVAQRWLVMAAGGVTRELETAALLGRREPLVGVVQPGEIFDSDDLCRTAAGQWRCAHLPRSLAARASPRESHAAVGGGGPAGRAARRRPERPVGSAWCRRAATASCPPRPTLAAAAAATPLRRRTRRLGRRWSASEQNRWL